MIHVALPKGRLGEKVYAMFEAAGYECPAIRETNRKLVFENEEKKKLINRLSRIEGQIRGIKAMVENDGYCADILTQTAAASSALGSFSKILLTEHIKSCVADDIRKDLRPWSAPFLSS